MDILADLRCVQRTRGDTFSSAEVVGMVGRAADEIARLRAALVEIAGLGDVRADEACVIAERALSAHEQKSD